MLTSLPAMLYHPCYSELDLPAQHRYPITKYQALYQQLLSIGVPVSAFSLSTPISSEQLAQVHCPNYIRSLQDGSILPKAMRRIGFPWSEQLFQRSLCSLGGTLQTAQAALKQGIALHLSGGYHHAFYNEGSGFCLFNDLVVAAKTLLTQEVDKILIIDLDVHQGDGSAAMLADDPRIISCSIHCEKNFPYYKQQSDWDVGVAKDCSDNDYLQTVQQSVQTLINWHQPDLVLYDAGVDIHQRDELGLLSISTAALYQRDLLVLQCCVDNAIPVAAVIGGGYQRNVDALVQLHLQLFKAAFTLYGSHFASKIET
ncbi:histone deacetylase family protein [Rheinheimera baltica]|uniref:histone deacetylase family protein n=1 Tax=Rheinheimera baltica TaxID=67576 RepID=UPI00273FBF59|nr:histone deacetylase [Rheinheimera baltica]MDP5150283.1 histone deacetylase [Rheinheimera baltica]